jgi:hypothetical protein
VCVCVCVCVCVHARQMAVCSERICLPVMYQFPILLVYRQHPSRHHNY